MRIVASLRRRILSDLCNRGVKFLFGFTFAQGYSLIRARLLFFAKCLCSSVLFAVCVHLLCMRARRAPSPNAMTTLVHAQRRLSQWRQIANQRPNSAKRRWCYSKRQLVVHYILWVYMYICIYVCIATGLFLCLSRWKTTPTVFVSTWVAFGMVTVFAQGFELQTDANMQTHCASTKMFVFCFWKWWQ